MVAKSPSKANDDRQPRQSNGAAIPPMIPARLPAPAPPPKPAPGPPGRGPRGIKVGPRLEKFDLKSIQSRKKSIRLTRDID